jgi:hypothetical protein
VQTAKILWYFIDVVNELIGREPWTKRVGDMCCEITIRSAEQQ